MNAFSKQTLKQAVWDALSKRQANQVVAACEQLNQRFPKDADGWYTTSQAAMQLRHPEVALAAIEKAIALEADDAVWLLQQGVCLAALGNMIALQALLAKIAGTKFTTAYQCTTMGSLLCQLGQHEASVPHYQHAIELKPGDSRHYYNLACLYRSLGKLDASEAHFNKTIALAPDDYEAYKIRSELRTHTLERNHIEQLKSLLNQGIDDERGRVQILFALAKELEDVGQYQQSFLHLSNGATLRRGYMRYDVENDLETIQQIKTVFSTELFEQTRGDQGEPSQEPIFILGMPRTGTTLVERILASHSAVTSAGELTNFAVQMTQMIQASQKDAKKPSRADFVRQTSKMDFATLGRRYIESTRPMTGATPHFIDKLPLNYLYAGLIHLALPNAKIINLKRSPMDTCYSVYKQLFVDAYPFSYDLRELGRYFAAYRDLMDHWHKVLPGRIFEVEYEQLVAEPESQVKTLLAHCDLPFEAECLSFYRNPKASTTASAVQIRQPIYHSSVEKWRHYERELAPLADTLRTAGIID